MSPMVMTGVTGRGGPAVGSLVNDVVAKVGRARASNLGLEDALAIEGRFMRLRAEAEARPDLLAEHIRTLREARRRFEARKAPLAGRLVDELHRVRKAIRAAEEREARIREALVWLSRSSGLRVLHGTLAEAAVKTTCRRQLPRPGTPDRDRLEAVVRAAGAWERSSVLTAARLDRVCQEGAMGSPALAEIEGLCRRRAVAAVRVVERGRVAGARPMAGGVRGGPLASVA